MYLLGGNGQLVLDELKNTPLGSLLLVRHVGHDSEGEHSFAERLNGWVDYMLLYVKRGTVDFIIDGNHTIARGGEVYIVPPIAKYSFRKNVGCETYFMHFEGSELLEHYKLNEISYKITATLEFENVFNKLLVQANIPLNYRGEFTSIYGILLLSYIARYTQKPDSEVKTPQDLALSVINWSFRGTTVIEDFARQARMTEAVFSRLIKEQTGMTPKKYITYRRIEEIKDNLANTDQKIKNLAEFSGYHDYQYFVKIFKKYTGMTPKEYRQKAKQQSI